MRTAVFVGVMAMAVSALAQKDWMIDDGGFKARLQVSANKVVLTNGIATREWFFSGEKFACTSLRCDPSREEFLRAVCPEAEFTIDGKRYAVGGLSGQPDQAFLDPTWLLTMAIDPDAAAYRGYRSEPVNKLLHFPAPHGQRVVYMFAKDGFEFEVAYELYDGQPLMTKQVKAVNRSGRTVRLDKFKAEFLAAVEPESGVDHQELWRLPNLTVTTDFTFAGMSLSASNRAVRWLPDLSYETQVNYEKKTPCLLEVVAPVGPAVDVASGGTFETFKVVEMLHDTTERERRSLQVRRIYRTLAPWAMENPIMLHLTSSDPKVVRTAIDQAAECGFEMIVISFWSGLDMEDVSEANLAKWRGLVDYAHSKNLRLGGYSLLASRSVDAETDVIDPKTGKPGGAVFGSSPCLGSTWGIEYFKKLRTFIDSTGFDLLEHDGSYPGDVCASTQHPGHRDFDDSQWTQYQTISEFYRWCQQRGVFLNVPDNYHLAGSNKTGMGYRESNWSLPRPLQHIHARQNLFDGTWEKTPSMGWMMVPLVEYQGGGPAATIEPLHEHLADYEMHLANNFGYGAQACYRGPRLYDTPEVKAAVIKWVKWFKSHREILESDVIHIRRANGRDLDAILHVDHLGREKGMFLAWNPTDEPRTDEFVLPLHYAGLEKTCHTTDALGKKQRLVIGPDGRAHISVTVPPRQMVWLTISQ